MAKRHQNDRDNGHIIFLETSVLVLFEHLFKLDLSISATVLAINSDCSNSNRFVANRSF